MQEDITPNSLPCMECSELMVYDWPNACWKHLDPTSCQSTGVARTAADWLGMLLAVERCSVCNTEAPLLSCPVPGTIIDHNWFCAKCIPDTAVSDFAHQRSFVVAEAGNPVFDEAWAWAYRIVTGAEDDTDDTDN